MATESELQTAAKEKTSTWVFAALICILASPVALFVGFLVPTVFSGGGMLIIERILIVLPIFSAIAFVGFVLGPIAVGWSIYVALTEVVFGLSEDHKYFICCTTKNQFEAAFLSFLPVLFLPSGLTGCMLIGRRLIWKRLTSRRMIAIALIATAIAVLVWLYFSWLSETIQCSPIKCYGP